MDTSAGISLRPSASLLCVLNGGDPLVVARTNGFRADTRDRFSPPPEPPKRGGLAGLLGRLTGAKPSAEPPPPFAFDRAAELLRDLKIASASTGLHRVAIAVPSWSNDVQRQQVADGARAANWALLGLVNEPTAAAMASGALREGDGTVLVYDLAEGRFDVTLVATRGLTFEVLSTDGLTGVGAGLALPDLLAKTEAPCRRALKYAGLDAAAIDTVVLVGETARDPKTAEYVTQRFGQPPLTRFDPEEVVGFGAAVHASILESR